MRFGWKVLISTVLILSLAFTSTGYLLLFREHRENLHARVQAALDTNQMICASVEGEFVNLLLRGANADAQSLANAGEKAASRLLGVNAAFLILDETGSVLYSSAPNQNQKEILPLASFFIKDQAQKQYGIFPCEEEKVLLLVSGLLRINGRAFFLLSSRDITQIFTYREESLRFLRWITLLTLLISSVLMGVICYVLTHPLRRLNAAMKRIAKGNLSTRAKVFSTDEIGQLTQSFNQMADTLQNQIALVQEEAQNKDDFVANFTHEIKTPLTTVIGYADLIRSGQLQGEALMRSANYVFTEALRLETMSMKLFDLLLLDKEDIKMKPVSLKVLFRNVTRSVSPLFRKEGKRLSVKTEDLFVLGDMDLLQTVLVNFLDNARKASESGQPIFLRSWREGDRAYVEVRDQGRGIAPENLARITQPFFMEDKARTRKSGGAGLGLSLAIKILDKHKAKWQIESKLGEGTSVYFSLPLQEKEDENA